MIKNDNKNFEKVAHKIDTINDNICVCGKSYKYISGLSRHKNTCIVIKNNLMHEEKIKEIEKNSVEEINKLKDENEKLKNKPTYITNNYVNNNLTMKLYLDENFGNAMTLDDFVQNLKIKMDDLTIMSNLSGFTEGMSKLIIKNLKSLQVKDRPIHCSDVEKSNFYIKTEHEWEKDNGSIMSTAIDNVKEREMKVVNEFMKNGLNNDNDNQVQNVLKIIHTLSDSDTEENQKSKIMKNIGNAVHLDLSLNKFVI